MNHRLLSPVDCLHSCCKVKVDATEIWRALVEHSTFLCISEVRGAQERVMSLRECCVLGCRSMRGMVPVHSFPKDPARLELWKAAVYSEKIGSLSSNDHLRKKWIICYRHFKEEDYIVGYARRKLKCNVVPTLHLPGAVSISPEETNIIETMQPSCSYEVQHGDRTNWPHIPVRASTTGVKISGDVQLSRSYNKSPVQETRLSNKKKLLRLLTGGINTTNLTLQKARLYKAVRFLFRTQTCSNKKLLTVKKRLRAAKKFFSSNHLQSLTARLSRTQQAFIEMQLRSSNFAPRGRRFSMEQEFLCLRLYKQSRRVYAYLESIFNLPSGTVLRRLLHSMSLQPGLNNNLLNHLKKKARKMNRQQRVCCLMWDEISLECVMGLTDRGRVRRPKLADVALVFMLRGIKTGWKLPLAFYFSDGKTTPLNLTMLVKEVTGAVASCGLKIVAYVCDQGLSNVKAITELVSETACQAPVKNQLLGNIIYTDGGPIVAVYDPPHLIKGIRNNLLAKDLEVINATGDAKEYLSWRTIELAFEMDQIDLDDTVMQKLTDNHVSKNRIKKMRVKHAVQVLSGTVARFISTVAKMRGVIDSARGPLTIPFVEGKQAGKYIAFFNDLFDACNGHTVKPQSKYRVAVSESSPHVEFWNQAIEGLERMQFVDPVTRQRKGRSAVIRNWLSTVQGFLSLNIILRGKGFKYWLPRRINQDPLEHFFDAIRAFGCRDSKPTALEFVNSLKILFIKNISTLRLIYSNREDKSTGDVLFHLINLLNFDHFQDNSE